MFGMKQLLSGVLIFLIYTQWAQSAELTIVVEGLRSTRGALHIALFDSGKGFPMEAASAVARQSLILATRPTDQPIRVVFKNLPEKKYAVCILHDEDSDGKLKTNFIGIPKEGVGVSNNAKGLLGPPKFEAAVFTLTGPLTISVTVSYF